MSFLLTQRSPEFLGRTSITNDITYNPSLSPFEKGAMQILLALPPNWKLNVNDLMKRFGCGRDKVYSTLKLLREAGYIKHVQARSKSRSATSNRSGTYGSNHYLVFDTREAASAWETEHPIELFLDDIQVTFEEWKARRHAATGGEKDPSEVANAKAERAAMAAAAGRTPAASGKPGSGGYTKDAQTPKPTVYELKPHVTGDASGMPTASGSTGYGPTASGKHAPIVKGYSEAENKETQSEDAIASYEDADASSTTRDAQARTTSVKAKAKSAPKRPVLDDDEASDATGFRLTAEMRAEVMRLYNAVATAKGLPECTTMGEQRRKGLRATLKDVGGVAGFAALCAKLEASAFCCGATGWRASFDFVIQAKSRAKLMEGGYSDEAMAFSLERAKRAAERKARAADPKAPLSTALPTWEGPTPELTKAAYALRDRLLDLIGPLADRHLDAILKPDVICDWLVMGAKPESDIVPAVEKILATRSKTFVIRTWGAFTEQVKANLRRSETERTETRKELLASGRYRLENDKLMVNLDTIGFMGWHSVMEGVYGLEYGPETGPGNGTWSDRYGPAPGEPGCWVPPQIQRRFKFTPNMDMAAHWDEIHMELIQAEAEEENADFDARRRATQKGAEERLRQRFPFLRNVEDKLLAPFLPDADQAAPAAQTSPAEAKPKPAKPLGSFNGGMSLLAVALGRVKVGEAQQDPTEDAHAT